jgi:hypothetical protein
MRKFRISLLLVPVSLVGLALVVAASLMAAPQESSKQDGAAKATKSPKNAKKKGSGKPTSRKRPKDVRMPGFSPQREAAAISFLESHHEELGRLLKRLKKSRPMEYKKAMRDIFRASERLTSWQDKSPKRYEVELKLWKLNSRIQLLAARMRISSDTAMKEELRQAILSYNDARTERLVQERSRMTKRVEQLDAAIEMAQTRREQTADRRMQQLLQGSAKLRIKKKAKKTAATTATTAAGAEKP